MSLTEKLQKLTNIIGEKSEQNTLEQIDQMDFDQQALENNEKSFLEELDNGYWGNKVAQIAMTYQLSRVLGEDSFAYAQSNVFSSLGILAKDSSGAGRRSRADAYKVRNSAGRGIIDCSAFAGLVLRGIPYERSPYPLHRATMENWKPWKEMPAMYGTSGWEYTDLDRQAEGKYTDLGFQGYSTIRTAADLAKYFYTRSRIVFDARTDGNSYPELYNRMKPGDLIFWAKHTASANQKKRFLSISHVGIVSEREDWYWHATSGSVVVLDTNFTVKKNKEVVLILRPNYRPKGMLGEIPIGENLIHYPWNYGATLRSSPSIDSDAATGEGRSIGLTYTNVQPKANGDNGIQITGTAIRACVRILKGSKNRTGLLHLSPGTYRLSYTLEGNGAPLELWLGKVDRGMGVQCRPESVDETAVPFTTLYKAGNGRPETFTIGDSMELGLRLYTVAGATYDCVLYPSLVRLS